MTIQTKIRLLFIFFIMALFICACIVHGRLLQADLRLGQLEQRIFDLESRQSDCRGLQGATATTATMQTTIIEDNATYSLVDMSNLPTESTVESMDYDKEVARIVSLESDGSYEGSLAVASVIYNRLESGRWGNTIHDVISAKNQFSTYGSTKQRDLTDNVIQACIDACNGKRNLPSSVMWFCTESHYAKSAFFRGLTLYDRFAGSVWCEE